MTRIKTLLVLSLGLVPRTYFGQALIKNFEYFSILNPAAAASRDSLAITTAHNYYDNNSFNFQNASLGGIEFELPRINSGFAFHTSLKDLIMSALLFSIIN